MRALISVSDKTGVVDFAKGLRALGWEVIATRSATAASRPCTPTCTAVCWRDATIPNT